MTFAIFSRLTTARDDAGADRAAFASTRERVRAAELAGINVVLLDDSQSTGLNGPYSFEAGTLAAALAVCTSDVGLVSTISTQQLAPYHVARQLASIDFLSGGRSGWEMSVFSDDTEAANYQKAGPDALDTQLARAEEFVRVVTGLWDSFEDDAFLRDRGSGIYFLPERLRTLNHSGEYFDVAGPLNIARPPQGHPVLVCRAYSAETAVLAGRTADVVMVPAALGGIRQVVRDAAAEAGRDRQDVLLVLDQSADAPVESLLRLASSGAADGFCLLAPRDVPADVVNTTVLDCASALRKHLPMASGSTLRDRLGLRRPVSKQTAA